MSGAAGAERASLLAHARDVIGKRAWADAYQVLSQADALDGLRGDDLEVMGRAAFIVVVATEHVSPRSNAPTRHTSLRARRRLLC